MEGAAIFFLVPLKRKSYRDKFNGLRNKYMSHVASLKFQVSSMITNFPECSSVQKAHLSF